MPAFKYDVAFSLLDADEPIAGEIARLLPAALSVFLYSERELETTGTDGIDTFSAVFRRDARIVVILYRERWAQTKWTRLEEQAIKSRFLDDGPNFLLLIHLEGPKVVPPWFPAQFVWSDFSRLGPQGAAAVIQERVRVAGGVVRAESPAENAERLERERQAENNRLAFLHSHAGVKAADVEVERLFDRIDDISGETGIVVTRDESRAEKRIILHRERFSVTARWHTYANTLKDSYLRITEWDGWPDNSFDTKRLREHDFSFDLASAKGETLWRDKR